MRVLAAVAVGLVLLAFLVVQYRAYRHWLPQIGRPAEGWRGQRPGRPQARGRGGAGVGRGRDVRFGVDEIKAIFDPGGGQGMNGRYVPSLLAAIGEVIERHMIEIGFMGQRLRGLSDLPDAHNIPAEGARARFC